MAAPRASSFKALRNLQKAAPSVPTKRNLHVTGVHSSPVPNDPAHKNAYLPLSLQDLRSECRKRSITPSGTKHELIDRLAGHDNLQARAFSIAMKRIATDSTRKPFGTTSPAETTPQRHFNTSRALKAVGDTSTIDFAFLPKLFDSSLYPAPAAIRVPILPHIESDDAEAVLEKFPELDAAAGGYQTTDSGHVQIMKPQIVTVHETMAEGTHVEGVSHTTSAMSDVHDGHHAEEMSVDMLTELTETVGNSARRLVDMAKDKDQGSVRTLWNGFLDDLLGPQSGKLGKV